MISMPADFAMVALVTLHVLPAFRDRLGATDYSGRRFERTGAVAAIFPVNRGCSPFSQKVDPAHLV